MDVDELLLLIRDYLAEKGILVVDNDPKISGSAESCPGYITNLDGFVIFRIRHDGFVLTVPFYFSERKKILVAILPDKIYNLCFILSDFFRERYDMVNMSCRKKENGLNSIILSLDEKVSGVKKSLVQELLKLAKRKE